MKHKRIVKRLAFWLALTFVLSGCAGTPAPAASAPAPESAPATEEPAPPPGDTSGFCVGVGRADITPESPVPLAGYGNVDYRISKRVLDPLYITAVAVRDEIGETLILLNIDLVNLKGDLAERVRAFAADEVGIAPDHVMTNCTHTHSAPALESSEPGIDRYKIKFYKAVKSAAADAVADLDACSVFIGTTETDRLNFIRRYYKTAGFITDNADYGTGEITAHETEIDQEMRLIRFVRENRKDIVMANWQCHPHRTGGSQKYDVSADIIGVWRKEAEKDEDVLFAFFQGGAGNIDPFTRIPSESRYTDYKDIGKALNEHMQEGLAQLREIAPGRVRVATATLTAPYNHADEDKLEISKKIYEVFRGGDREKAREMCKEAGLSSYFEAGAIIGRVSRPETGEIPLACYAIGDIAITAAPFETFCQSEQKTRAGSPFAMTFSCGYANGSQGYLPAAECYQNRGYEVAVTHYARLTAEMVVESHLELLADLAANP